MNADINAGLAASHDVSRRTACAPADDVRAGAAAPMVGCLLLAVALACAALNAQIASAAPIEILFVGNSFTFGKYAPVRNYQGGYDSGPGAVAGPHVHDLQCLSAASCSAAEGVATVVPSTNPAVINNGHPSRAT